MMLRLAQKATIMKPQSFLRCGYSSICFDGRRRHSWLRFGQSANRSGLSLRGFGLFGGTIETISRFGIIVPVSRPSNCQGNSYSWLHWKLALSKYDTLVMMSKISSRLVETVISILGRDESSSLILDEATSMDTVTEKANSTAPWRRSCMQVEPVLSLPIVSRPSQCKSDYCPLKDGGYWTWKSSWVDQARRFLLKNVSNQFTTLFRR